MTRLGPVAAATFVAAACFATSARADDEFAVLHSQLEQVKALVADMEARLAELQAKRCAAPPSAPTASSPPVCTAPGGAAAAAAPVTASVAAAATPAGTIAPTVEATPASVPAAATAPAAPPASVSTTASAPVTAHAGTSAATSASSAPPPATPAGEVPRAAWHQVQEGLSKDDVQRLLGPPTRTFELPGRTVWYYVYPEHGAGSVFFDTSGKVSSEQAPTRW